MVVAFTLIGITSFYKAIEFINKNETDIKIDVKNKGLISILVALSTTLLYLKYKTNIEFYMYFYVSIYLLITAYIDYKTKNVYTILNYITMIVGIFFLFYQKSIEVDINITIICVIIYTIFVKVGGYFDWFGGGDTEIFIALSIFVSSINMNLFPLVILLINMILSNLILIISNIKNIDVKRLKLKEPKAFAPSIAISTMILILLL